MRASLHSRRYAGKRGIRRGYLVQFCCVGLFIDYARFRGTCCARLTHVPCPHSHFVPDVGRRAVPCPILRLSPGGRTFASVRMAGIRYENNSSLSRKTPPNFVVHPGRARRRTVRAGLATTRFRSPNKLATEDRPQILIGLMDTTRHPSRAGGRKLLDCVNCLCRANFATLVRRTTDLRTRW